MKSARYSLIYQFFASQIEFGYYKTGDFLPSIDELCNIYHASSRTVRCAYLQLQEDGYVRLSSGRRTTVVYRATAAECGRNRRNYYMARKDAALSLNAALRLLLLPLMREGCGRMDRKALGYVREMAVKLEDGDFYISFFGGHAMIAAMENQLALALFYEVISFDQFPHTLLRRGDPNLPAARYRELSGDLVDACGRNDRAAFFQGYLQLQSFMDAVLHAYLLRAEQEHPPQEQVPFTWKIYRERPQHCYSVASRIIREIYLSCRFTPGSPLPYHGALADKYHVSYMTIRRTMGLLESMGVVSVQHGGGTTVVRPGPEPARYQDRAVQRLHTMALEAMQILRLAFDGIVPEFFPRAVKSARDRIGQLRAQQAAGLSYPAFLTCMDLLLRSSSNPSLLSIWDRLSEVLALDLPLLEASGRKIADPSPLIRALESADAPAFRAALYERMMQVYETSDMLAKQFSREPRVRAD